MDWATIIPAALTGLASGGVASLIAPWAQWGVKKREFQVEARRELIKTTRQWAAENRGRDEFRDSHLYSQLKGFLSKESVDKVEQGGHHVVIGPSRPLRVNYIWDVVLRDVALIERKWALI